uniref:SSD domain-containing protein n=2 Tax=Clytia hemisphaerica TaxID=252671 RepID=A0A7M5VCP8_9CNID
MSPIDRASKTNNPNTVLQRASDTFVEIPLNNTGDVQPAASSAAVFTINRNNDEQTNDLHIDNQSKCEALETIARTVRKKIHVNFYRLGCQIQKHFLGVALFSFVILAVCIVVPLNKYGLTVETDIQNIWVASSGRLSEEVAYSEKTTGRKGFQNEAEFGYEVLMQTAKDESQNMLTSAALQDHLEMVKKVKDIKSKTFGVNWTLRHICDRYRPPDFGVAHEWNQAIDNMVPCLVMTPLDCFWEGSIIASYGPHYTENLHMHLKSFHNRTLREGYKYHNPQDLVNYLGNSSSDQYMYKRVKRFVDKVGLGAGYMDRPCFATHKCPSSSNVSKDIAGEFQNGCYGVARKYMYWPKDVIVSKMFLDEDGFTSAHALQTVFKIQSPKTFLLDKEMSRVFASRQFGLKEATKVIDDWKLQFTKMVKEENEKRKSNSSNMLAFSTTSFKDLVKEFSNTPRKSSTYVGLILLTVYSIFTLKRWSSTIYSYGGLGLIGVVCAVASVFAGLCLASFSRMSLNTISVQVLPFLALGLGLDNIYLMARTYVFVCDRREFKCKEIVGMCLGEVGLDITLASFANTCSFLLASFVPIGAVQTFAKQAAIIYGVNWFTVIFAFSSILSFDVVRQRHKHMDLLFCFKECADDDDDDDDEEEERRARQVSEYVQSNISMSFPGATPDLPPLNAQSRVRVTTPSVIRRGGDEPPPPRFHLSRASAAQRNTHRSFNVTRQDRERLRRNRRRKRRERTTRQTTCKDFFFKLSLTYFAQHYYGPFLVKTSTKIISMIVCLALLIISLVGVMQVEKGLDLSDMVPKQTTEYQYFSERQKYFSYYKVFVVIANNTDGTRFDYANNQQLVYDLHRKLYNVGKMVKTPNRFWLDVFSSWLREWQTELREQWREKTKNGTLDKTCLPYCQNTMLEVQRIFELLTTPLRISRPTNPIGCTLAKAPTSKESKKNIVHRSLVNEQNIINPDLFYLALSLWHTEDSLGLWESEVEMLPRPPITHINHHRCHFFPEILEAAPEYSTISFEVHNIQTNEDYVQLIKDVRKICDEFKKKGLNSYPTGIPFTYWEQFVSLDDHLIVAITVLLSSIFLVALFCSMNLQAALFIVSFLGINLFETVGFIGLCGIKLSAISIIPLMMSVGAGTQFIVHSVMAFLNTEGTRDKRVRGSLEIMFASVFDCCLSSVIMIAMLASSKYDFIVRYFFQLMLWIILISMLNTLVFLPVMLSIGGPGKIQGRNAIAPVQTPTYFKTFPGNLTEWNTFNPYRRNTLSTVPEESSYLNSRSGTPANRGAAASISGGNVRGGNVRRGTSSSMSLDEFDEVDVAETSFEDHHFHPPSSSSRRPTPSPAWSHTPHACTARNERFHHATNYRNLPAKGRRGRGERVPSSNKWQHGERGAEAPKQTYVEIEENEHRVTTKIKTTIAMEFEYSHPFSVPEY